MAYYIVLSKLTDEGRKTLKQKPSRILEVDKELEAMEVKVKEQFAVRIDSHKMLPKVKK